jgi:Spy/CpxP family protein refolding chaperone
MSRGWFLALALSIGLNAGLLWVHFAGGPPGFPPPLLRGGRPGPSEPMGARDPDHLVRMHLERMSAQLDLSDEQRRAVEATLRERVPRLLELRERVLESRRSVADAYRGRPLDGSRFRELVQNLRGAQAELDSITAELMLKEAEILTPEQRERYAEVMPWGLDRRGLGGPPGGRPPEGGPPGARSPGRPGRRGGI